MEFIDILIIVATILSLAYGFWRGFVQQIGAIAGVIVGVAACRIFGADVASWVGGCLPVLSEDASTSAFINKTLAYIILFTVCYCATRLLATMIESISRLVLMGILDRLSGALFSMFQCMLILSLFLNLVQLISPESSLITGSTLANGHAIKAILDLGPAILGLVL